MSRISINIAGETYLADIGFNTFVYIGDNGLGARDDYGRYAIGLLSVACYDYHPKVDWRELAESLDANGVYQLIDAVTAIVNAVADAYEAVAPDLSESPAPSEPAPSDFERRVMAAGALPISPPQGAV